MYFIFIIKKTEQLVINSLSNLFKASHQLLLFLTPCTRPGTQALHAKIGLLCRLLFVVVCSCAA